MSTLAERILALNDGTRSTREIAEAVYGKGCPPKRLAYVRVVTRQRENGTGCSEADKRYFSTEKYKRTNRKKAREWRKRHPEYRSIVNAYMRALRKTRDKDKCNAAEREARRLARCGGKSAEEADRIAKRAKSKLVCQTGDKAAARKAYAQARQAIDRTNASGGTAHA